MAPAADQGMNDQAKKNLAEVRIEIEARAAGKCRFNKVPKSALLFDPCDQIGNGDLRFDIPEDILSTFDTEINKRSKLASLPNEILLQIFKAIPNDNSGFFSRSSDAACLALSCKRVAKVSQATTIRNDKSVSQRLGWIKPGYDLCNGCHKQRSVSRLFWSNHGFVIQEWLDEASKFYTIGSLSKIVDREECVTTWLQGEHPRKVEAGESTGLLGVAARLTATAILTTHQRARQRALSNVCCPTCAAQDLWEETVQDSLMWERGYVSISFFGRVYTHL